MDPRNRRRVLFLSGVGGALLLALLFLAATGGSGGSGGNDNGGGLSVRPSSSSAGVQEPLTGNPAPAPSAGASDGAGFSVGGGQAVSLLWRFGLVVIIIGVCIVGLRWWGKRTSGPRSSTGYLRVVDTMAISNGRSIHLIALGERVIAVGATAQQLSYLTELTDAQSSDVLATSARQGEQSITTFASELFQSMRGEPRSNRHVDQPAVREEAR